MKGPARPRLRAFRTSPLGSWWAARLAVRAGVPLDAFLHHRLAQHLARLPVPAARLPVTFSVDGAGAVAANPTTGAPRAPWLEAFLRAEGAAAVTPEVLSGQADAARLAARIDTHRARAAELSRDLEAATRGVPLADPDDEAQARQMGRPIVPPAFGLALQAFAALLVLAHSWQLAMGSLALAGIRTRQLPAELQRDPVNVVLGALFALGASATLFLLAHRALRWVAGWLEGDALRSRVASALTSFATAALALALAAAIVAALPGAERFDPRLARLAVFLVVLVIPFTGGWLFDLGRRLEGARAEALASARAWDREHYRILRDLGRRTAALEEEERRLAEVEAQRAAVLERLRTLQRRAAAAERLAADAAGEEGQELARLAQAVGTALELDRYRYLRLACARGQPMPGPEATTAPAGPPPLRAGREVAEPKLGLAG